MSRLFVYGTLLRGELQDGLVAAFPAEPATTRGVLYRAPAGYPALVSLANGADIHGELLTLSQPGVLQVLDLYEGVPEGLYQRRLITVALGTRLVEAHAYVVTELQARRRRYARLACTDWRHLQGRTRR